MILLDFFLYICVFVCVGVPSRYFAFILFSDFSCVFCVRIYMVVSSCMWDFLCSFTHLFVLF